MSKFGNSEKAAAVARHFDKCVIVLTGSNRGIGLGFVDWLADLLKRDDCDFTLVACCRTVSEGLKQLVDDSNGKIVQLELDIAKQDQIDSAIAKIEADFGRVDILINNAGKASKNHPIDPVVGISAEELIDIFTTNTVGTINVTNAFLPLLRKSQKNRQVVTISSKLASIEKCHGYTPGCRSVSNGGVASYRITKAAMNMAMRCFAAELQDEGFIMLLIHPGWVATDMGSSRGRTAHLSVDQSVEGLLDTISKHTSPKDNGMFVTWDGEAMPW